VQTNASSSIFKSAFTKSLIWFSLSAMLLISVSSAWTFYSMNQLIRASQERREIALGKGLAIAISDSIVSRDYAQLEGDLQQAMGNTGIRSVLVSDLRGNVLAFLERKTEHDEVRSNFSLTRIDLPTQTTTHYIREQAANTSVLWYQVNPGIPLGWIRIDSFDNLSDALETNFRSNVLGSILILFLVFFASAATFFYRAKQKTQAIERRLISSNEILHTAVHIDSLTQLPNRLALAGLLDAAMEKSKQNADLLAICFIDLDEFKGVNDRMGHLSGDNLLIAAAGRMLQAVRDNDSVVRLGGDEFVLLLGSLNSVNELDQLLTRILELLSSPFMIDGQAVLISASIGATIFPTDTSSVSHLLAHADIAMYGVKRKGKNAWALYPAIRQDGSGIS
jgi:diguanylate cyclase (GGDEF)-like protein